MDGGIWGLLGKGYIFVFDIMVNFVYVYVLLVYFLIDIYCIM